MMNIYTYLQRGDAHPHYCEDFLFSYDIAQRFQFYAVMDGCSMGQDSHFASALIGKVLKKVLKEMPYHPDIHYAEMQIEELMRHIFRHFFETIKAMKNQLLLDTNEMLATLLALLWDEREKLAYLVASGDGLCAINHEIIEFDQQNHPDYPAYHLGMPFESWYDIQPQKLITQPHNLAISTDGVNSYRGKKGLAPEDEEVEKYFLTESDGGRDPNMLSRKARRILKEKGWYPLDDVAIIRLISL